MLNQSEIINDIGGQTWGQIQSICILLYLNTLFEVLVFVFVF